jgi:hypothetical protein
MSSLGGAVKLHAGAHGRFSCRAEIRPRRQNKTEYLLSERTSRKKSPANVSP